jgi:hypothetical protein
LINHATANAASRPSSRPKFVRWEEPSRCGNTADECSGLLIAWACAGSFTPPCRMIQPRNSRAM